ncbi:MAG: PqqD family protein [Desulfobacterium sp.]|nr:PqqD family protein [Desulfobacterium sp.]
MTSPGNSPLNRTDALSCIPEKSRDVREVSTGPEVSTDPEALVLSLGVAYRPLYLRVRRLMGRSGATTFTRKVELDLLGAQVWHLIDGKRDVGAIIREFAGLHGLDLKEAEVSVTLFLRSLGKKGLIGMGRR